MTRHCALSAMTLQCISLLIIISKQLLSSVELHSLSDVQASQCMSRRRTYTQTVLPGAPALQDVPTHVTTEIASQRGKPVAEHKLVRTDR